MRILKVIFVLVLICQGSFLSSTRAASDDYFVEYVKMEVLEYEYLSSSIKTKNLEFHAKAFSHALILDSFSHFRLHKTPNTQSDSDNLSILLSVLNPKINE